MHTSSDVEGLLRVAVVVRLLMEPGLGFGGILQHTLGLFFSALQPQVSLHWTFSYMYVGRMDKMRGWGTILA